jgi:hypothetical protein
MRNRLKDLIAFLAAGVAVLPLMAWPQQPEPTPTRTLTWTSGLITNTAMITADTSVMSSSWTDHQGTKHTVTTEQLPGETFIDAARRHSMAVHALQQVFPPSQM